jgi:hypothetical protein
VEGAQSCPSLARVLERVLRREKPEIFDLGPFCGESAVYLAERGARVTVDDFVLPVAPPAADGEEPPPPPPLRIDRPSDRFDLVLAWDHADYVPPDRLESFGAELGRLLAPGGWLLLFAHGTTKNLEAGSGRPARYRIVADGQILREDGGGPDRDCWCHATRAVERSLSPLSIQGIHLQRDQTREFLALKPE